MCNLRFILFFAGTFAEENEKVSYGLVHPNDTAVPHILQVFKY